MPNLRGGRTSRTLAATLLLSVAPAWVSGSDLTTYRTFKLGADFESVAKQTGVDGSRIKVLHTRPALIQQFEWRPGGLGPMTEPDTVKDVVFTFYQGELYQIVANYGDHGTEGMTAGDFTESISLGMAPRPSPHGPRLLSRTGTADPRKWSEWHDELHRYVLIRSAYGPSFRLVGTQQKLQILAEAAIVEAMRLDELEAQQREAARLIREDEAAESRLDKSRRANKPKF